MQVPVEGSLNYKKGRRAKLQTRVAAAYPTPPTTCHESTRASYGMPSTGPPSISPEERRPDYGHPSGIGLVAVAAGHIRCWAYTWATEGLGKQFEVVQLGARRLSVAE
jgi:hypothetical protein